MYVNRAWHLTLCFDSAYPRFVLVHMACAMNNSDMLVSTNQQVHSAKHTVIDTNALAVLLAALPERRKFGDHLLRLQAAATREVGKVLAKARSHADAIRESADHFFFLNQELQASAVPVHDVHTAREVLETGESLARSLLYL